MDPTRRICAAAVTVAVAVVAASAIPSAAAHPSEPGVVSYAVLGKGSVGNIVGGPMGFESVFTEPVQGYFVDLADWRTQHEHFWRTHALPALPGVALDGDTIVICVWLELLAH